jgi:hypothetical protein
MASKYNFQQNNGNGTISDDFYLAIRGIGYVLLRLLRDKNNLRSNTFNLNHFSIIMVSKDNFRQKNGNGNISDDFYLAIQGIGYVLLRL